jgi:hypothetical protein
MPGHRLDSTLSTSTWQGGTFFHVAFILREVVRFETATKDIILCTFHMAGGWQEGVMCHDPRASCLW